jgi:hypothetical protein
VEQKVCKRCGAILEDDHSSCIDCGEYLGSPISKEEEESMNHKVSETITKLSNKKDYFYVRKSDKAVAALSTVAALFLLISMIFFRNEIALEFYLISLTLFIAMLAVSVNMLFPKLSWALYQMRFMFSVANPDDIQPSDTAAFEKRIMAYIMLAVGYIYITYLIVQIVIAK